MMTLPEDFDFEAADDITIDLMPVIMEHKHDPVNLSMALLRMAAVVAVGSGDMPLDTFLSLTRMTYEATQTVQHEAGAVHGVH